MSNMSIATQVASLHAWRYMPQDFFCDIRNYDTATDNQILFFQDIADMTIKSIILCSARGTGKTDALATTAIWSVTVLPYFLNIPIRVVVISGSQLQSDILYDYCIEMIEQDEYVASQVADKPLRHQTKFKRGWIKALPASLKSTLGHRGDLLIIDEAVEAGDNIIKRAFSILSGSKLGRVIISSTPHEYMSFFVDIWEQPDEFGFVKHGYWSQLGCPWITAEQITRLRQTLDPVTFAIDVLGEPRSPDTFFPLDDLKECRTKERPRYNDDYHTQMGIDWGWAPAPTVITIVQVLGDKRDHIQVLYQKPFKRMSPKKLDKVFDALISEYNIQRIYADRSHIHENQRLIGRGHQVQQIVFRNKKPQLMGELRRIIMQHEVDIWENELELIKELRLYTEEKKKGQDRVDSLALACWKSQKSKSNILAPRSGSYRRVAGTFTDTLEDGGESVTSKE